jgi:DNA-binding IclR family transcriptional regulator
MGIAVPNPPLSKNNDLTQKLLDYVRKNGHAKTGALIEVLGSPRRSVIRMLNKLIADGRLVRDGNGPGAVYKINEK